MKQQLVSKGSAIISAILALGFAAAAASADKGYHSPCAVAGSADGRVLYVAEQGKNSVAVVNTEKDKVADRIKLPDAPGGLALSPDGKTLYVTNCAPEGLVRYVDTESGKVTGETVVGHSPVSPVPSPDGALLYVCNQFNDDVSVVDLATRSVTARIAAGREPVAAAITPDGKTLAVANLLPSGASDGDYTAASVTLVDTASRGAAAVKLPNGSTGLHGVCVSPDGAFAYVTHLLSRYQLPTTQLERGWMNTNALTVVDLAKKAAVNTVLLDDVDLGAANPWAAACTADGRFLCVTHAGTHEISVIDRAGMHAKLDKVAAGERVTEVSATAEDVPNDLSFLVGLRRRVKLAGNGPRALFVSGTTATAAMYFTGTLDRVDVAAEGAAGRPRTLELGREPEMTAERKGEMFFFDADLCFQHWQSCGSCHPDARVDGLNWDLLNDGIGNPKNTKNMLLAHQTPPAMSLGVREDAEYAVRSGIKFIQFAVRPDEDAAAIDAYLKALKPVPSPRLEKGALNESAKRGQEVFGRAGCADCHAAPLHTDLGQYDVGTAKGLDAGKPTDTPTLVEAWRTAPYLHDGRSATIMDVLKAHNPEDKHGKTSDLSEQDLADLAEYVLSL